MLRYLCKLLAISITTISLFTTSAAADEIDPNQMKLLEVFHLLKEYHISGTDGNTITEAAIDGMIASLDDPYTDYFSDQEFENYVNSMEGHYSGVGMVVGDDQGQLKVYEVYEGSPAKEAGIQVGDILVKVGELSAKDQPFETVMSHVIGEEGTPVTLTFLRNGNEFTVTITRKTLNAPQVFAEFLPEKIGYLYLATFTEGAIEEFNKALQTFTKQGAKGIILDLRDNPGGLFTVAEHVAGTFIDKGTLVIVKDGEGKEFNIPILETTAKLRLPLAVLVNENSASSSEIVAAALQDHRRATIIGTRTYGKGTIQELIPLQSNGYLKLTIEEYYTPLHKPMNHIGVTPDILVGEEIEQLQAASYVLLNNNKITLKEKGEVWVNDQPEVGPSKAAILRDDQWYLSMRKLAYLFHGKVGFNPQEKKITLQLGDHVQSFSTREVRMEQGTAYLHLDQLLQRYPQLTWNVEKSELTLQ